jgi:dihydroorotate dehydrogenase
MYTHLRRLLFFFPPETSHRIALEALRWVPRSWLGPKPRINMVSAMGLTFPHRVGLAAGFDKDGQYLDALRKLSFSFIEIGTVTPQPQSGQPQPRLFRLPKARALINRMGFNNQGVEACVARLAHARSQGILGINIGKNKDTPIHLALNDYQMALERVYSWADYVTVNLSSPNTADLRLLQQEAYFKDLLNALTQVQKQCQDRHQHHVPLVVKCSPDEDDETLKRMTELCLQFGISGIIATNTTLQRSGVAHLKFAHELGGLSGAPLFDASTKVLKQLKSMVGDSLTLIASGGIDSPARAQAKIEAGADLIQLYTGLIYEGPGLIRAIAQVI